MVKLFIDPSYDVKSPTRDEGNAGIDFYIPNYNETFLDAFIAKNNFASIISHFEGDEEKFFISIPPHRDANIPSGIRSFIPKNVALEANNKSGIATKKKLVYGASVVDANYQGIIHCHVINISPDEVRLELGTKIVQFIPRIIDADPIVVDKSGDLEKFYEGFEFNNRGDGAFGSTGLK